MKRKKIHSRKRSSKRSSKRPSKKRYYKKRQQKGGEIIEGMVRPDTDPARSVQNSQGNSQSVKTVETLEEELMELQKTMENGTSAIETKIKKMDSEIARIRKEREKTILNMDSEIDRIRKEREKTFQDRREYAKNSRTKIDALYDQIRKIKMGKNNYK